MFSYIKYATKKLKKLFLEGVGSGGIFMGMGVNLKSKTLVLFIADIFKINSWVLTKVKFSHSIILSSQQILKQPIDWLNTETAIRTSKIPMVFFLLSGSSMVQQLISGVRDHGSNAFKWCRQNSSLVCIYTVCLSAWIHRSHVMRLWHFPSSVNLFFKHACTAIQWG